MDKFRNYYQKVKKVNYNTDIYESKIKDIFTDPNRTIDYYGQSLAIKELNEKINKYTNDKDFVVIDLNPNYAAFSNHFLKNNKCKLLILVENDKEKRKILSEFISSDRVKIIKKLTTEIENEYFGAIYMKFSDDPLNLSEYKANIFINQFTIRPNNIFDSQNWKDTENNKYNLYIRKNFTDLGAQNIHTENFLSKVQPCQQTMNPNIKLENFQNYLNTIFSSIIDDPEVLNNYLDVQALQIFTTAITHESYDPEVNYEMYENIGDAFLKPIFTNLLILKHPNITPQESTEWFASFMSTQYQAKLCVDLKLDTYILTSEVEPNQKIKEDVFEAFCGAIYDVGDKKIHSAVGFNVLKNFLTVIFNSIKFELSEIKGKPKTVLQQRGSMLSIKHIKPTDGGIYETHVENVNGSHTVSIKLSNELLSFLRLHFPGKSFTEDLCFENGITKAASSEAAWAKALKQLEKIGYNSTFANQERQILMFKGLNPEKVELCQNKARLQRVTDLQFKQPQNSAILNVYTFMLIGVNENRKKIKLAMGKGPDLLTAKRNTLDNYLEITSS